MGDEIAPADADAWAQAGGTAAATDLGQVDEVWTALADRVQEAKDAVVVPDCSAQLPRITLVLDASSDMLNVGGAAGAMGETPWDRAGELFDAQHGIFDATTFDWQALEHFTRVSLVVFGGPEPMPGEQQTLVPFRACAFGTGAIPWAVAPGISCVQPGCDDPWGGPPIEWTVIDPDDPDYPSACDFPPGPKNHMPRCDGVGPACAGSGRATHLGLLHAKAEREAYHAEHLDPDAEDPVDDETRYAQILVTGGSYQGYSTDAQVQAALEDAWAAGVTTYVVGVGEAVEEPAVQGELDAMAAWGSGGELGHFTPATIDELQALLVAPVEATEFDPCCAFPSCVGDEGSCEPDPVPPTETGDSEGGSTDGETTSDDGDDGDGSAGTSGAEASAGDGGGSAMGDVGEPETGDVGADAHVLGRGCGCTSTGARGELAGLLLLAAGRWRRSRRPVPG